MFSCRAMILGYIGIVGTLQEIDSIHPDHASPSSKLHVMSCSYHVKGSKELSRSRVQVPTTQVPTSQARIPSNLFLVGGGPWLGCHRNSPAPGNSRPQQLCECPPLVLMFSCNAILQVDHLRFSIDRRDPAVGVGDNVTCVLSPGAITARDTDRLWSRQPSGKCVNGRGSSEPVNNRKPEMVRGNQRWSEAEDAVERGGGGGGGNILHSTPSSNRPYSFLTGLVRSDHCPFSCLAITNVHGWLGCWRRQMST
jgi:hypothetical protein